MNKNGFPQKGYEPSFSASGIASVVAIPAILAFVAITIPLFLTVTLYAAPPSASVRLGGRDLSLALTSSVELASALAAAGYPIVATATPTATPLPQDCLSSAGGSGAGCDGQGNYGYGFNVQSECGGPIDGIVTVQFEVSDSYSGPWTNWEQSIYGYTFQPGLNHLEANRYEGPLPPVFSLFRFEVSIAYGGRVYHDATWPVQICGPILPTPTITPSPSPTPSGEPEWDILQYVINTHPQWTCGPIYGTPGHRYLGCYTGAGHTGSGSVDNYGDPAVASANWQQKRTHAQGFYPIFYDDSWNGYPGYHGEGNVPPYGFFTRENFYVADVRVLGGVSVDDTPFHYAPDIAYAIMNAASALGYLPPPSPTPTATITASPTRSKSTPPPPTPSHPDLVGSALWLASCDAATIRLRTQLNGPPYAAGPSTMRLENRVGDHQDFAVPALGYPNPTYYDYICSIGPCIPTSWQNSLPYTLTVDIFNQVIENNEFNNSSIFEPPVPTPVPCAGTFTPTPTSTRTPVPPCVLSFTDVPPGHTYYDFVMCLACRGIVSGYNDGTFKPGNNATRGQLAKIISESAGFADIPGGQIFADVPVTQTYYVWVNRLAAHDVVTGYPCGGSGEPCGQGNLPYFRPSANTTRGQLAKMVVKAAGWTGAPSGQTFEDVPPTHTFYPWIEQLASRSIIGGYPCGSPGEPCIEPDNRPYFRPANDVTRGQTAKIVANTFFPACQTEAKR